MILRSANECLQVWLGEHLEEEESPTGPLTLQTVGVRWVRRSAASFERECDLQAHPYDLG